MHEEALALDLHLLRTAYLSSCLYLSLMMKLHCSMPISPQTLLALYPLFVFMGARVNGTESTAFRIGLPGFITFYFFQYWY